MILWSREPAMTSGHVDWSSGSYLPPTWTWASFLTSLHFSFLICKLGINRAPEWIKHLERWLADPGHSKELSLNIIKYYIITDTFQECSALPRKNRKFLFICLFFSNGSSLLVTTVWTKERYKIRIKITIWNAWGMTENVQKLEGAWSLK